MPKFNNIKLLLDNKVDTKEFGTIYFPTVEFIKEFGDAGYNRLLFPFILTVDNLDISDEYKEGIRNFDLFFQDIMYDTKETCRDVLLDSLRVFFRLKPVFDAEMYCIFLLDEAKEELRAIHRDNFDDLAEIILLISKAQRSKEKPPKIENEIQRDVYEKLREGRRKKAEKNQITFATMVNIAMNCGNSYVSPEEINKMTIFQLIGRYEAIVGVDYWNINFDKYLVGVEPKELDLEHWTAKIRL